MPLKLRVVEESLSAAFDRADVLALAMSHQMLSERRGISECFAAVEHMASENFVSGF